MSRNDKQNLWVLFGVTALVVAVAALWLTRVGLSDDSIRVTVRHSAHFAFVLYLVVLVARPLQQLLRANWTAALLRKRRLVGVAFAAAMTGHLVFSTLHTNDSASAITRLVDMGVEPFLISSSVLAVVAQRLIRVLCDDCKKAEQRQKDQVR